MGHPILDATCPMECVHYQGDLKIISVLVFLNNGITVYHKAVVNDISSEIDPQLLSSFLDAINMFGKNLTQEEISQIQFQKMNILICRANYSYGAMLLKGEVNDVCKTVFSEFLDKLEGKFPDYFSGEYVGKCLPEEECDALALSSLKKYMTEKLRPIPEKIMEHACSFKCAH